MNKYFKSSSIVNQAIIGMPAVLFSSKSESERGAISFDRINRTRTRTRTLTRKRSKKTTGIPQTAYSTTLFSRITVTLIFPG